MKTSSYPFLKMFTPSALRMADPFLEHESSILEVVVESSPSLKNMVVVGSGPLAYSGYANGNILYVGVDPYFHIECGQLENITSIKGSFEDLTRDDLREGPTIFVFWFNVFFYLEDPYRALNSILRNGDIVIHSTCSRDPKGKMTINRYFEEIYRGSSQNYRNTIEKISACQKRIGGKIFLAKKIENFSNGINSVEVVYT